MSCCPDTTDQASLLHCVPTDSIRKDVGLALGDAVAPAIGYNNGMSQTEPSQPAAPPRRFHWRRLFQFRLRTLLILTTIIAIWLGWWADKARQQKEAVAALRKVGARITYDTRLPCAGWLKNPPKWPQWILDHGGMDYFANVQYIDLHNTQVTDTGLEQLKNLTFVQHLELNNTQITDAGLEHLRGLTALQGLYLQNTQVTDVGLEHLQGLGALQILFLTNTRVTDAGVEHFKSLTALVRLDIASTPVTDVGLENLKGLTTLQMLSLDRTQVSDAGVARLEKSLPNCVIAH